MQEEVQQLLEELRHAVTRPWAVMEVCGGQTHAIASLGLEELLPPGLRLIHGPGCPVCVTAVDLIDQAVELSLRPGVVLCSYGDMMRVPGSLGDLFSAKARGGEVLLMYSPLEAVSFAGSHPEAEVVFFAVGFETTAPATALAMQQARALGYSNFSVLCAHVQVPPALEWLMDQDEGRPDAFLAPGHVCAITGEGDYGRLAARYRTPMVVTGFEAPDLLRGILMCVRQLENGECAVRNAYGRYVKPEGNRAAQERMKEVFEPEDRHWRGLGLIPGGGMKLRREWEGMDAALRFGCGKSAHGADEASGCLAGQVLRGLIRPAECPFFGTSCTPLAPMGAPMVSGEGACAAYYRYKRS